MSSIDPKKTPEESLRDFNEEINNFLSENKDRIICMMAYSVSFEMQPYVASYQRYFNHDIISTYNAKTIYVYNLELPHFINVYFILKKATDNTADEKIIETCKDLIDKFSGQNEHVLAGLSALFFDSKKQERIDEFHFGDKETLKEIQTLQL